MKIFRNKLRKMFFFAFLILLITSTAMISSGKAQTVPDVDTHFETVRGSLFGFYNSELISHAGIILGLTVGFVTLFPNFWKAFNHKTKLLRFLGTFLFLFLFVFIIYSFGRLLYWSSLNATLIGVTRKDVGLTNSTDPTSYMNELSDYCLSSVSNSTVKGNVSLTSRIALGLHPNSFIKGLWIPTAIIIIVPSIVNSIFYKSIIKFFKKRKRKAKLNDYIS